MKPTFLLSDIFIYVLVIVLGLWMFFSRHHPQTQTLKNVIFSRARYIISVILLSFFAVIGLLDSIHFTSEQLNSRVVSVLDLILTPLPFEHEETYSAPFALQSFVPEFQKDETGKLKEVYPTLEFAGRNLKNSQEKKQDILIRVVKGLGVGLIIVLLCFGLSKRFIKSETSAGTSLKVNYREKYYSVWITLGILICFVSICLNLLQEYHILGTDKVGRDVFYVAMKSIRTGLVIGLLTTLVMLPFALILGMWAGYFRGMVDDIIQYIYITLSSVPAILLIAASVLVFQLKIEGNPDLKLLILCFILGITSWTSLCRLLRGETLKLRDSEFVQAAITLGVSDFNIIRRHILPNLMHIVIITLVLDFSGLVLSEAVLTYVGVGVDASTYSFGNMINAARLEMVRDPMVWWSLVGSFCLMFTLVFSANIFSEAVQDALNPRNE